MMGGALSFSLLEVGSVLHPSIGKAGLVRKFEVGQSHMKAYLEEEKQKMVLKDK